jgi:hypothetical protein
MLWYLDLAARHGIVVTGYQDDASGTMTGHADGSSDCTMRWTSCASSPVR